MNRGEVDRQRDTKIPTMKGQGFPTEEVSGELLNQWTRWGLG